MKIATWNVNSLKVRLGQVLDWLERHPVDCLCLQETKLDDPLFPADAIAAAGYHVAYRGQPGYNGVAILSKWPLEDVSTALDEGDIPQRRLLAATINGVRIVNVYVPNGQSLDSPKFVYKLGWLAGLRDYLGHALTVHEHLVVLGDFNIAPEDRDVYDPAGLAGQVLLSAPEREALRALLDLGLVDAFRRHHPDAGLYSWWDYRAFMFRRKLGMRIDLILVNSALAARCRDVYIDIEPRRHERPSDHAPVTADFAL